MVSIVLSIQKFIYFSQNDLNELPRTYWKIFFDAQTGF